MSYLFGEAYQTTHLPVRDILAQKLSPPEKGLDEWTNAKPFKDSLTAVHRFVAYNAGWLQQALGKELCNEILDSTHIPCCLNKTG